MEDYEIAEQRRKRELRDKVEKATRDLIDALNVMGRDEEVNEAFFETVTSSHRTLQASLVRTIGSFLEKYGNLEYFDGRNEAAVKWAKLAVEGAKTQGIPYI